MIEGAPGHGEGHNSGQAVNVSRQSHSEIMEQEKIPAH
jgi:aminobenzoyl-glutamate utilization protein B